MTWILDEEDDATKVKKGNNKLHITGED